MKMNKRRFSEIFKLPAVISFIAITVAALSAALAATASTSTGGAIVDRALVAISRSYYDPSRVVPKEMLDTALDKLQLDIPEILITDRDGSKLNVTVGLASKMIRARPMSSLQDLSRTLKETLSFALDHYISKHETTPAEVEYGAVSGILDALDPHSGFLPPKVYREFKIGTKGKFGGIGIVISIKDGMLTVVSPLEGTPASGAGIMAGDRILQIDDESTINMSLTDAVNKLRGDVGAAVTILVESLGKPARKVTLTRAVINIQSVQHSLITEGGKRIGYIKIKNFQSNTCDDMVKALSDLQKDKKTLDGLILDMRNNPGGLLNIAVDVANRFLAKGIIVSTIGARNRVLDMDSAKQEGTEPDYPIVVLINEGSASASEIVAGALALNDRAVLVGSRTFGKGSVQTLIDVGGDAAIKLTIAQYKPAGKQSIQLAGIAPAIALVPATAEAGQMNIIEDKAVSEKDLEKHLEQTTEGGPLSEPVYRISHITPARGEKWREERSLKEYARTPDLADDFAVEFAKELIVKAGDASASMMLKAGKEVVEKVRSEQNEALVKALAGLGIDWKTAKAEGRPSAAFSHRLIVDGKPTARVRAGDKVRIEVTAANNGKGPFSRLIGVNESEAPFLADLEFPFGRIDPGKSRRFTAEAEVPLDEPAADWRMTLKFKESNGNEPNDFVIILPVAERPSPAFSFKYETPGLTRGKKISMGASIQMPVEILNSGKGASDEETVATISNECGEALFIEKGRTKIGALAPGASRKINFSFRLIKDERPEDGCALNLAVVDFKSSSIVSKKIEIDDAEGKTSPPAGVLYSPPSIDLSQVPRSTNEASILISGTIRDTDPVRDCYLFAGRRKIAYLPNVNQTKTMAFSVNVPLEEGYNRITIGARDIQNIKAQRVVIVERRKPVPKRS